MKIKTNYVVLSEKFAHQFSLFFGLYNKYNIQLILIK